MIGILESLTKATVGVVFETPIAIVADVVTLRGVTDNESYTTTSVKKVMDNLSDATKSDK